MPFGDLRAVAHQLGDFVEALALHGELAAERVAVVQRSKWQHELLVLILPSHLMDNIGLTQIGRKIIRFPPLPLGTGKQPRVFSPLKPPLVQVIPQP